MYLNEILDSDFISAIEDATYAVNDLEYYISDLTKFYNNGSSLGRTHFLTTKKSRATIFKNRNKAKNALERIFGMGKLKMVELNEEMDIKKEVVDLKEEEFNIAQELERIQKFVEYIEEREFYLSQKQSEVDKAMVDIEHSCEFSPNLDISEGYKKYKILSENMLVRRRIKDELLIVHEVMKIGLNADKVNATKKKIKQLKSRNRQYQPRLMSDIFEEYSK